MHNVLYVSFSTLCPINAPTHLNILTVKQYLFVKY